MSAIHRFTSPAVHGARRPASAARRSALHGSCAALATLALAACGHEPVQTRPGGAAATAPVAAAPPVGVPIEAPGAAPVAALSVPVANTADAVPVDGDEAVLEAAPESGADPSLFFDAGPVDAGSLAIAARQRALDVIGIAVDSVNERALAGSLDERELACIDGEYPYPAWFCGNDGDGVPVPAERFGVTAYDHVPDAACERAIAGAGPAARACDPTFADIVARDGATVRYERDALDGRGRESLALAGDVDDLEIDATDAGATLGVCRIAFDLDAGAAPVLDDPAVCKARLRRFLAD